MKIRRGRDSHEPDFDIDEKYWEKAKRRGETGYIEYSQIKNSLTGSIFILTEGTSIVAANNEDYVCRDPNQIDKIWTMTEDIFNRIYEKLEG